MELKKLKARLSTAQRGHKLLKDKSDEMVRRFTVLLREDKRLRDEAEGALSAAMKQFALAGALTPSYVQETALAMPSVAVEAELGTESIMGVEVPAIRLSAPEKSDAVLPYAFSEMTSEADESVREIAALLPTLMRLAEVEKAVRLLAVEIERNKRRVNALEYVMIPQLEETIKYIRDKLDENERAALVRLMKVKPGGM